MDKSFHFTLYWACDYLSIPRLKLKHVSKRGHKCQWLNWKKYRVEWNKIKLYWWLIIRLCYLQYIINGDTTYLCQTLILSYTISAWFGAWIFHIQLFIIIMWHNHIPQWLMTKCDWFLSMFVQGSPFVLDLSQKPSTRPGQAGWCFVDNIFKCILVNKTFVSWLRFYWSLFLRSV